MRNIAVLFAAVLVLAGLTSCATKMGKVAVFVNPQPPVDAPANIYVDGMLYESHWAGRQATDIPLPVGQHKLRVSASGYETWIADIYVHGGEQRQDISVPMKPIR